jgi:hypothetical protein
MRRSVAILVAVLLTLSLLLEGCAVVSAAAPRATGATAYPRTANYYLGPTPTTEAALAKLASYDLVILPAEAQEVNRQLMLSLRRRNPHILLLAYFSTKSFNFDFGRNPLHQRLLAGIDDSWWLGDTQGKAVSTWPGSESLSLISGWKDELPRFLDEEVWRTQLWDGIFLDEFSLTASWINGGDLDIHGDGLRDDPAIFDAAWRHGTMHLLHDLRERLGPDAIIVANGESDAEVSRYLNGRMFEDFPTPWLDDGTWAASMRHYLEDQAATPYPAVNVLNVTTHDTGVRDPRHERWGFGSTLLGDGFVSVDHGIADHAQLWRATGSDGVVLGAALGAPINLRGPLDASMREGVWRRWFEGGVVVVNSSAEPVTVRFGQPLRQQLGEAVAAGANPEVGTLYTVPPWDASVFVSVK